MTDKNNSNNKINSSLMFMAGIILVIIAGLTFVTTGWQVLSGIGKIGVMCLVTVMFFGSSAFALKLKLNNTGNALYTLACFFATLTMLGCGCFNIFGQWLSITGKGSMFLFALTALVLMASSFYGGLKLMHRAYGFIFWSAVTVFVVCVIYGIKENTELGYGFTDIAMSIYAFVMVLLQRLVVKSENSVFSKTYHIFVIVNTTILAIPSINKGEFISMAMYTVSWLNISLNDTEEIAGGLLSGVCMFMAISWLIDPVAVGDYIITFSAFACAVTFISMGQLINNVALKVFKIISAVSTGIAMILCACNMIIAWDLYSQLGIALLLLNNIYLIYKNNMLMKYVQPFVSTLFNMGVAICMYNNGVKAEYANVVILILQSLNFILTVKLTCLRSNLSDLVLALTCGYSGCVLATMGNLGYLGLVIFVAEALFLLFENKDRISSIALSYILPHIVWAILYIRLDSEFEMPCYFVLSVMTLAVVVVHKNIFKHLEKSLLIALCFYSFFYFLFAFAYLKEIYSIIFTMLWCIKAYLNKDTSEKTSTFITALGIYITSVLMWLNNQEINLYIPIVAVPALLMILSFVVKEFQEKLSFAAGILANVSIFIMLMLIAETEMTEFVIGVIFALLTYSFICYRGNNTLAFLPLFYVGLSFIAETDGFEEGMAVAVLYVVSIGIHYLGGQFKQYQKIEYTAFMGIVPSIYLLCNGSDLIYGCVLIAVLLLLSAVESENQLNKSCFLTGSAFMLLIGLLCQNIVDIPDIISTEYNVALIIGFAVGLKYIWGGNKAFSMIIYLIGIACILALFTEATGYGYLMDSIILGLTGFLVMLSGYVTKKKKWFMLGTITLIFVSIYMTKDFWLSLGWWVYLLLVGAVLIIIAGVNEWKKYKG